MGLSSCPSPTHELALGAEGFAKAESCGSYSMPHSTKAMDVDASRRLARDAICRILAKVLRSAECLLTQAADASSSSSTSAPRSGASDEPTSAGDASDTTAAGEAEQVAREAQEAAATDAPAADAEEAEAGFVEIRWLASGNSLCLVPALEGQRVAQVKAIVQQRSGLSILEQHLLHDGRKLPGDALAPRAGSTLLLVRSHDPRVTDLRYFHSEVEIGPFPPGKFTRVRKLADGINGDVCRYNWQRRDGGTAEAVAVKKVRSARLHWPEGAEADERRAHMGRGRRAPPAEDPMAEIGILTYLAKQEDLPPSLLRMHAVFASGDSTWLVTEFADGGDFFELAASGHQLPEPRIGRYARELLEALEYLHRHHIGHRDVSLENLLLKGDSIKLMDFGMSVSSHKFEVPLRFFRSVGKDAYRAPEVYVPSSEQVRTEAPAELPADGAALARTASGHLCEVVFPPEAEPGQPCMAEVWGYAAQPVDVFAAGVCLFILAWQSPPWRSAILADPLFFHLYRRGDSAIAELLLQWQKPLLSPDAMQLITHMLRPDPQRRPSAGECLQSPWLAGVALEAPPLQAPARALVEGAVGGTAGRAVGVGGGG